MNTHTHTSVHTFTHNPNTANDTQLPVEVNYIPADRRTESGQTSREQAAALWVSRIFTVLRFLKGRKTQRPTSELGRDSETQTKCD